MHRNPYAAKSRLERTFWALVPGSGYILVDRSCINIRLRPRGGRRHAGSKRVEHRICRTRRGLARGGGTAPAPARMPARRPARGRRVPFVRCDRHVNGVRRPSATPERLKPSTPELRPHPRRVDCGDCNVHKRIDLGIDDPRDLSKPSSIAVHHATTSTIDQARSI